MGKWTDNLKGKGSVFRAYYEIFSLFFDRISYASKQFIDAATIGSTAAADDGNIADADAAAGLQVPHPPFVGHVRHRVRVHPRRHRPHLRLRNYSRQ